MKLYDSINESLSKKINSLNEELLVEKRNKKVEVSPEDEKDNAIIRQALDDLNHGKRLSDEEKNVLDKYNIGHGQFSLFFDNGDVDAFTVQHDFVDRQNELRDFNKVNFVDMARKQKERQGYYETTHEVTGDIVKRGSKKNSKQRGSRKRNTLDIERAAINKNLQKDYKQLRDVAYSRRRRKSDLNDAYEWAETYRQNLINRIKELKQELQGIDGQLDEKTRNINGAIDKYSNEMRDFLNNKRDRIKSTNKNESLVRLIESLLTEKKQSISPEDERDNKLLRSAIRKIYNGKEDTLTNREQSAIERNGLDIGYWGLTTPEKTRGTELTQSYNGLNGTKYFSDAFDLDKINLVDMGRKAKQRSEYTKYIDNWAYSFPKRNRKKLSKDFEGTPYSEDSNLLNLERQALNQKLFDDYDSLRSLVLEKKRREKGVNYEYEFGESKRQSLIDQIKALKKELSELDDEIEYRANNERERLYSAERDIKNLLNQKHDEIETKRKKRNEQ